MLTLSDRNHGMALNHKQHHHTKNPFIKVIQRLIAEGLSVCLARDGVQGRELGEGCLHTVGIDGYTGRAHSESTTELSQCSKRPCICHRLMLTAQVIGGGGVFSREHAVRNWSRRVVREFPVVFGKVQ